MCSAENNDWQHPTCTRPLGRRLDASRSRSGRWRQPPLLDVEAPLVPTPRSRLRGRGGGGGGRVERASRRSATARAVAAALPPVAVPPPPLVGSVGSGRSSPPAGAHSGRCASLGNEGGGAGHQRQTMQSPLYHGARRVASLGQMDRSRNAEKRSETRPRTWRVRGCCGSTVASSSMDERLPRRRLLLEGRRGLTLEHDAAACLARLGAETRPPVRVRDDVRVMLHDDERVAALDRAIEHAHEAGDVAEVEAVVGSSARTPWARARSRR